MTVIEAPVKPPYRVPLMSELPRDPDGPVVATFFAGGGGSSLGYRMAGCRVAFANEIVPEARDCYLANAAPYTVVDGRDVREVTGSDVLDAVEKLTGSRDLHILDGSPPCQSFSTAGIREKGWGKEMSHADGTSQVSDDLFFEYARILGEARPRVFVAENVSGLVKGKARGYFTEIHARLVGQGYRVQARLLDARWLGVPQARQRVVFMGVRDDLELDPVFPDPLAYLYSIRDALPNLTAYRYDTSGQYAVRDFNLDRDPSPTVTISGGAAPIHHKVMGGPLEEYLDPETGYDLALGSHAIAGEWDKLGPGQQSDRYFSLVRPDPDEPIPTVTASNNRRGVAGVTHPMERRKLTLAELRRLCSFPDDFLLPGTYQEGWTRLGNAVPPVMMFHVAVSVRTLLDPAYDPSRLAA